MLADNPAAVPDVAEDEERGSRNKLEVDWRKKGLRGPSSALGEARFLVGRLENGSTLPVAAGLDGDLGSSGCPGVAISGIA